MTVGLCVCVVLAVLCSSCLGLPFSSQPLEEGQRFISAPSEAVLEADTHSLGEPHLRHSRSNPQLKTLPANDEHADSRANLSELLARLISSRKGSVRRNSMVNNRSGGLTSSHRIADRDYLGWMDFGRRSAEEYEYSS
ncbi:cholecystokinin [Austrofundulus limnaeus]|uniref:Cholecystokinin n=1 Tax=Austrofundulus limnaeus TaxID=52670 RepID=A0A2I4C978_AUSLI|nr:PREDICTED: cholecystokinin-like [Austrofundulus limnaeus]